MKKNQTVKFVRGLLIMLPLLLSSPANADKPEYQVLQVPGESPGTPWYADFGRQFIPTDGEWVSIVFWRDPASVPPGFNLLDFIDFPNAYGAPLLLEGREWWLDVPFVPGNLVRMLLHQIDLVPVYFVKLEELEDEIGDDVLTIGELEDFSSLRIGMATHVSYDVRQDFFPGKNGAHFTANGVMEDGGRFQVRLFEIPNLETGISDVDAVIQFTGSN